MPVIEAMAAGIPVTCSNGGSLPEVAGDAALLFNPYNVNEMSETISKIIEDDKFRQELIQRGYKQAKKFSDTDAMIDEYIATFEEVMIAGGKK
jgi:glycosyltransferase involved in cell wall biosynthesis